MDASSKIKYPNIPAHIHYNQFSNKLNGKT